MDETTLRPCLLLVRPEAQSRQLLTELTAALGVTPDAVISPLFEIISGDRPPSIRDAEALVMTSPRAGIFGLKMYRGRVAHVVGHKTREVAESFGLVIGETAATVEELARKLSKANEPLLYLRGENVSHALGELLPRKSIREVVVYRQPTLPLTAEARELVRKKRQVVLPLYSARSASLAASALAGASATIEAIAISPATAAAWPGKATRIAKAPDGASMFSILLERLGRSGGC